MPVLRIVASDEVIEVTALEGVFFESEVLVGAKVVDPEFLGPRFFLGGFALRDPPRRLRSLRESYSTIRDVYDQITPRPLRLRVRQFESMWRSRGLLSD